MSKFSVTIDNKEYPIKMTMGALIRFKQETGKDIQSIGENSTFEDNLALVWCSIKSACNHDHVPFDMSLMDFADSVNIADVETIVNALLSASASTTSSEEEGDGEKNAV